MQEWLSDWDDARDALIAAKVRAANARRASFIQTNLVLRLAYAVEGAALSIDRLPQAAFLTRTLSASTVVQWAKDRTQEANGVLMVSEDDIDRRVGRQVRQ